MPNLFWNQNIINNDKSVCLRKQSFNSNKKSCKSLQQNYANINKKAILYNAFHGRATSFLGKISNVNYVFEWIKCKPIKIAIKLCPL